jgi:hypothetical protein
MQSHGHLEKTSKACALCDYDELWQPIIVLPEAIANWTACCVHTSVFKLLLLHCSCSMRSYLLPQRTPRTATHNTYHI